MTTTTDDTWALLVAPQGSPGHLGKFESGGGISRPLCGYLTPCNMLGIVPASSASCADCARIAGEEMRPDMDTLGETIDRLEFDTVFEVKPDGTVIERHDLYAPEVSHDDGTDVHVDGDGWECLTGMTGQYSYVLGRVHHRAVVGSGIAERLYDMAVTAAEDGERLAFAVVVVSDPDDEDNDAGWAIAYRKVTS